MIKYSFVDLQGAFHVLSLTQIRIVKKDISTCYVPTSSLLQPLSDTKLKRIREYSSLALIVVVHSVSYLYDVFLQ